MIWISFNTWTSKHGHFLSWARIYKRGKWTPFCRVEKRYDSWFGHWKKPKPMTWLLIGHTVVFASIPSDTQIQEALDAVEPLGFIPTDRALASNGMFELHLKDAKEPDWKISIPDGHGNTASITYKGNPLRVTSARLDLQASAPAVLMLEVYAHDLEAVMSTLDVEINIVPKEAE